MKYMILTYGSQQDYAEMSGWSQEDFAQMVEFMQAFSNELVASGELVDTRGLAAPVHTRRVRLEGGVAVVTDGPYAETQEVLAGYWIVECESYDRATEIAARLAKCPNPGGVFDATAYADVRPLVEGADEL
ncbi:MAG TPA: YciI family protein [Aldersonia sp.]